MSSSTSFGSGTFGSGPLGTAPFMDVQDIINNVLYATGHSNPATEDTKREAVLQFINNTYQEICMGKHYAWMFATYDISIFGPNQTGTISATNNDATITGVGTLFSANDVKAKLAVTSVNSVYNVSSITSQTELELETKWANDDVADSTFKLYNVQYQMPTEVGDIRAMVLDELQRKLIPVGPQQLRIMQSRDPLREGPPTHFALIRRDVDDDGVYAEFFPMPDKDYNIHIDYTVRILKLDDVADCYPIIPDKYRAVLFYGALAQFYRYLKNAPLAADANRDFMRTMMTLKNDTQLTDSKLVIKNARNYRARSRLKRIKAGGGFQDRTTFGRDD